MGGADRWARTRMSEAEKNGSQNAALMLQIRADALRAHLTRIRGLLSRVPNRRKALEDLESNLKAITDATRGAEYKIFGCRRDLEDESDVEIPTTQPELKARLESLMAKIRGFVVQMKEAEDISKDGNKIAKETLKSITEMKQNCFRIETDDPPGELLGEDLKERTKPAITALDKLKEELAANGPNADLWRRFRDKAFAPSQRIFAEYVYFLGGLALRDTGFDEGISRIAEDLIRTYKTKSKPPYPPMALPVRKEAVARTLARVVRVGFPEWTVWALPFTAHEFWHAIAREDFDQALRDVLTEQKVIGENDRIPERYQNCLADAFATYTMGPAYAYSALFLLLTPLCAYAPPEQAPGEASTAEAADETPVGDDTRAKAILEMLRLLGGKYTGADYSPYVGVSEELGKTWAAAKAAAVPGDTARTEKDNGTAVSMVRALWKVLESCTCSPFLSSEWNQLPKLQHVLLDQPLAVGELRKVLNTIWKWRVSAQDKKDTDVEANMDMDTVAERVRDRILKKPGVPTTVQSPHLGSAAPPKGVTQ